MEAGKRKVHLSTAGFFLVVTMVVTIAGLYFYNLIRWADYPDFGFGFRTATGIKIVGVVWEHGKNAGIQTGDRILQVNGKDYKDFKELREIVNWELGARNIYRINRGGREQEITIINTPVGFKRSFGFSGLPFAVGVCYALIG